MHPPCVFLTWDTAFWGVRTARIHGDTLTPESAEAIESWCDTERIACLYFLARSDDMHTTRLAEDHGFRFVDIRMTFRRPLTSLIPDTAHHAISVRSSSAEDRSALEAIARESYRDTRFYYDGHFLPARVDTLYATWIAQSIAGDADRVLVVENAGIPIGYITCHCNRESHIGEIGLIGVAAQARGKGIGQTLLSHALTWFASQGLWGVTVVTQGRNSIAQRLYQRNGFVTDAIQLWYHRWYEE